MILCQWHWPDDYIKCYGRRECLRMVDDQHGGLGPDRMLRHLPRNQQRGPQPDSGWPKRWFLHWGWWPGSSPAPPASSPARPVGHYFLRSTRSRSGKPWVNRQRRLPFTVNGSTFVACRLYRWFRYRQRSRFATMITVVLSWTVLS